MNKDSPFQVDSPRRANIDYHHGDLRPAVGVQSFQVFRANRGRPDLAEGSGWTYNHAPMIAYWKERFYLEYLSNPSNEHVAPGRSMLTRSSNGIDWERPEVLFPVTKFRLESNPLLSELPYAESLPHEAIMHQRMGFYTGPDGRLLALGFYGLSPQPDVLPFGRYGIGRVVREIHEDGSFGPICFIHLNEQAGWDENNVEYPFYKTSEDPGFIDACEALLADSLYVQQWKEEHGDEDPRMNLKGNYKAFVWHTLPDGRVAGFWKWALAGITPDRGKTWESLGEVPTLEHAGAKIWAQRTSDGRYALVYNPSMNNKHRWPLAITTGDDGLHFGELLVVGGQVPPRRYWGGRYKDYGLNYVRGITEGNGVPPDGALWVAYSMNKEDIWITRIPVPVKSEMVEHGEEVFDQAVEEPRLLNHWNTYTPAWARVGLAESPGENGARCLTIEDREPADTVVVERVVPKTSGIAVHMRLRFGNNRVKPLYVELWDEHCQIPVRLIFNSEGKIELCHGRKTEEIATFEAEVWHELTVRVLPARKRFEIELDHELLGRDQRYQGEAARDAGWYFRASSGPISRIVYRTGPLAREPHLDMNVEDGEDLQNAETPLDPSLFQIGRLKTAALEE